MLAGDALTQLDGHLARKWNQYTVLGSILDPAADKALMTTLVGTLAYTGLLPSESTKACADLTSPPCRFDLRAGFRALDQRLLDTLRVAAASCKPLQRPS